MPKRNCNTTEKTWHNINSPKAQALILSDKNFKPANEKIHHNQRIGYSFVSQKHNPRKIQQKQELVIDKNKDYNGRSVMQYGLRGMYKYGGEGIFGQITIQ